MVVFTAGDAVFSDEFSVVKVSNRHGVNTLPPSSSAHEKEACACSCLHTLPWG